MDIIILFTIVFSLNLFSEEYFTLKEKFEDNKYIVRAYLNNQKGGDQVVFVFDKDELTYVFSFHSDNDNQLMIDKADFIYENIVSAIKNTKFEKHYQSGLFNGKSLRGSKPLTYQGFQK